jgi:hypothetical protein
MTKATNRLSGAYKGVLVAFLCVAISLIACLFGTTQLAFARDLIDVDAACSLKLDGVPTDNPNALEFKLYKVADVSEVSDSYTLAPDFATEFSADAFNVDDSSDWDALASKVWNYAQGTDISAIASVKSDANGNVDFGKLDTGLYLVMCQTNPVENDATSDWYVFSPTLIQLPSLIEAEKATSGHDTWVYDVTSTVKPSMVYVAASPEPADETPVKATVIESLGATLPQTGMLLWPVPVLVALGLAFILAGLLRRRHYARDAKAGAKASTKVA